MILKNAPPPKTLGTNMEAWIVPTKIGTSGATNGTTHIFSLQVAPLLRHDEISEQPARLGNAAKGRSPAEFSCGYIVVIWGSKLLG